VKICALLLFFVVVFQWTGNTWSG